MGARQRHQFVDGAADDQLAGDTELGGGPADDLAQRNADPGAQAPQGHPVAIQDPSVRSEQRGALLHTIQQRAQPPVLLAQAIAIPLPHPIGDDGGLTGGCVEVLLFDLLDYVVSHQFALADLQQGIPDGRRLRQLLCRIVDQPAPERADQILDERVQALSSIDDGQDAPVHVGLEVLEIMLNLIPPTLQDVCEH